MEEEKTEIVDETSSEPTDKPVTEEELKKTKREIFWVRFGLYVLFGVVIPCAFLIWRFDLFKVVNKMQTNIWFVIMICFMLGFFISVAKQVRKGLKFSLLTQCLDGIGKVLLPLLIAILCIYFTKDFINEIMQFLIVVFVCEIIAIPVNPLPKWCYEHELENDLFNIKKILSSFKSVDEKDKKK